MKFLLRLSAVLVTGLLCLCMSASDVAQTVSSSSPPESSVMIPGPLRSFLRMAGISQKVSPENVLPLLARNVYLEGYQDGRPTEFLILLDRYVQQARELQALAGGNGTIHTANCEDARSLIQILGYRLRLGCGQKNAVLVTASPERAFLTIDSGFPLTDLEEALQKNAPFVYSFPTTQVPVLSNESNWTALTVWRRRGNGNLIDVLLHDPVVARLYWALSRSDAETRAALQRSPGFKRLLPYASTLDFYGSQICIHSGRVIVPGEASTEQNWKDLVGASPESPGEFVPRLLGKDKGWLAAYFDVLSRVSRTQQDHLTEAPRLKRLYEAFRSGAESDTNSTKGVFRKDSELLILFNRLRWESNGEPHVPGSLAVWQEILNQKIESKVVHDWSKRARSWDRSEQVLEAMVAFSHIDSDSGPLQIYLMLNELDNERPPEKHLTDGTVRLLASRFSQFSNWYLIFAEFPDLDDTSITRFVNVADGIDRISNVTLRGNVLGAFQANIGLWQILARQGEIPAAGMNPSWQGVVEPFAKVSSSIQLFDAAHNSLGKLLIAASGKADCSQEELIGLLAGPSQESADGQRMHQELAGRIRSVLDDQRLVSLDTLFALSDGLHAMEQGATVGAKLIPLAGELREFEMPRAIFTKSEKIDWAPMVYSSRHTELQVRTDLTKVIKAPGSPAQLEAARGQLAPFLRDTLVGLNYAYYEPPGDQILHNNPLFVRSHDFTGITITGIERIWRAPELFGVGTPAGGGAYLIGSLADLSYALATTEEDFIAPENVQALIWKEVVPDLLVSATLPRWWNISPNELHAVTLYQRSGEELLTASSGNKELQDKVVPILSDRMSPQRLEWIEQALQQPERPAAMLSQMMPADTFYLGVEFHRKFPEEDASLGPASQELANLCRQYPKEVAWERLSRDFGVPHPTLAQNNARVFLNVKPFPAFGGYSSRLFSESWESNNLYWARLADEMGYSPVMLNRLAPELTRLMVAKIFATDLEDWPALLRAMQEAGEEFRQGKIALLPTTNMSFQH